MTGHSMGGHGAWHLATHYPDMALAVVSLASWIRKEDYGDSNLFFRWVTCIVVIIHSSHQVKLLRVCNKPVCCTLICSVNAFVSRADIHHCETWNQ